MTDARFPRRQGGIDDVADHAPPETAEAAESQARELLGEFSALRRWPAIPPFGSDYAAWLRCHESERRAMVDSGALTKADGERVRIALAFLEAANESATTGDPEPAASILSGEAWGFSILRLAAGREAARVEHRCGRPPKLTEEVLVFARNRVRQLFARRPQDYWPSMAAARIAVEIAERFPGREVSGRTVARELPSRAELLAECREQPRSTRRAA